MADPRERYVDDLETLKMVTDRTRRDTWTAMPGIIEAYNDRAQTVTAQIAIQATVQKYDGTATALNRTLLVDCPVQFPAGAGHGLTFPIAKGDECLLVFSARCIDAWWQNGGVQPAIHPRTHSLSDGFAILGFRSKPRALSNVSTTSVQLRSDDGTSLIDLNGGSQSITLRTGGVTVLADGAAGTVGVTAPQGVVIDAPTLACTGEIIAGYGGAGAVHVLTHKHPTAEPGSPSSPTPGS